MLGVSEQVRRVGSGSRQEGGSGSGRRAAGKVVGEQKLALLEAGRER